MKDCVLHLKNTLAAKKGIEEFIARMSFEDSQLDDKTASAVMRKLEVIGEAAKQVPDELRAKYPAVPWKEMSATRGKPIHSYFDVDYASVW